MLTTYEVELYGEGRVARYPWDSLSNVGDVLVVHGRYMIPWNVREAVNRCAKKRGWKLETFLDKGRGIMRIYRRA